MNCGIHVISSLKRCVRDSSANVREAIGYIPWYFNLPDTTQEV